MKEGQIIDLFGYIFMKEGQIIDLFGYIFMKEGQIHRSALTYSG